ncbi:hypothetical protein TCAL_09420, partial [Tigriopus californicus]
LVGIGLISLSVQQSKEARDMITENFVAPLLDHFEKTNFKANSSFDKQRPFKLVDDASTKWKFFNFNLNNWEEDQALQLKETFSDPYFIRLDNGKQCFRPGTDLSVLTNATFFSELSPFGSSKPKCPCLKGYFGKDCGIPEAAWFGHFKDHPKARSALRPRSRPRRIIHGVPVNHEFDFLEARIRSLSEVVDVFVIQESNFTTFGAFKEVAFLHKLQQGWLREFQEKVIYSYLPYFREKGRESGWYADAFIRMYLSKKALPMIKGKRDDDLFLLLDADELPNPEILLFLKLYDGYTEPIKFGLRWNVFGFYWLKSEDPSFLDRLWPNMRAKSERLLVLTVICTLGMMKEVFKDNAMLLRRNVYEEPELAARQKKYAQSSHGVREWTAGTVGHYAGFHCSWCYSPEGIRTKLLSAQKHDSPRWGDYPEKTNVTYIAGLIRSGAWFDGTKTFISVPENKTDEHYAPKYILDHSDTFHNLLERPKSE